MKCENCGNDLVGASIVCRQCNHNNAQGRVSQWRARRSGELTPIPAAAQATVTRTISPLASPAADPKQEIERAIDEPRPPEPKTSSLLPFDQHRRKHHSAQTPVRNAAASAAAENDSDIVQLPAWRAQLKEKVKQVRERRSGELQPINTEPDEAQLDPNPIVESALKRIRWSQQPQPITQKPATAVSEQPKRESEAKAEAMSSPRPEQTTERIAEPRPIPKPQPAPVNPMLARKSVAQPVHRPDTGSLAERPTVKTEPVRQTAETRVRVEPATPPKPAPRPAVEAQPVAPKIRTTGEIKPPATERRADSGSLAQPPKNHVETQVIGLAPALNSVIGYANSAATTAHQAAAPDTNPFARPSTATLWIRTLAGACDFEIVAVAYLPLFAAYAMLDTSFGFESLAILFVLLAALTFCYQFLSLTIANRTTGMAFLKLRLVNIADRDKPVAFSKKALRAAGATVAAFLSPINFLVMQSNPQHHSLPDLLSGTTLIERTSVGQFSKLSQP